MFEKGFKHLYAVSKFVQQRTQMIYGIIRGIQQAGIRPGEDTNNEEVANLIARQVAHRLVGLPLTDPVELDSLTSEIEREQELQQFLREWARRHTWGSDLAHAQELQRAQKQR